MEKKFKVKVDESFEFDLKTLDAYQLDLLKLPNNKFHVIQNGKSFNVKINQSDFYKRKYVVTVNKSTYTVDISNQLDQVITKMGFSLGSSKKANEVKAPMPGMILSINVKEGQEVKEGETLLILEAMKMENAISAPKDGIVKSIQVKNNGTVEKGELMIQLT